MESINQMKMRANEIRRKSKKLLAFTIMTVAASAFATTLRAQTFAEWFRQKSTQKKYLLQQIAALQVYAAYYKAGNNIAHNGLGSITGYLKSENGLHTTYYNNLNNVSPVVKDNQLVKDILQWQNDILTRMNSLDKTANFNNGEKKYITQVKAALFKDCDQQITELQNVVTDNKLKMSDEERLKHIGVIHSAMQRNYRFASTFSYQVKVYALQRLQEGKNLLVEKKIYGIQ
ncbi:hypothetical protein [Mucilaginibacter paludis]|uniref:Conjugative transposon protein TraI n=1 Tax=Mucilaginibacter paludis DSM 18603 TaxID=714943 RepID=H1Y436_9SPHI|nr:hypothetical protein [Mucilaginibacter paludis]EHQ24772.1 hypothetical protein Mucpa_0580 [Mucilaginibacter paludis DSM 18603]